MLGIFKNKRIKQNADNSDCILDEKSEESKLEVWGFDSYALFICRESEESTRKSWDRIRKGHNFVLYKLEDIGHAFYSVDYIDKLLSTNRHEE